MNEKSERIVVYVDNENPISRRYDCRLWTGLAELLFVRNRPALIQNKNINRVRVNR